MRAIFIWLSVASIYGCASVTPMSGHQGVTEATESQVQSCDFIGSQVASSPFYGVFAGQAMNDLREKLFASASASGATHIVLSGAAPRHGSTEMQARAYRCEK